MALRYFTADWIYPVSSPRIKDGVVVMQGDQVKAIGTKEDYAAENIEYFKGILIPGFINTHCHLELSHLKGRIDTGIGLLAFLERVVRLREHDQQVIDQAIAEGDHYMWTQGIQAVGDISNKKDSFEVKRKSQITYFTFVELFDFMQGDKMKELISGNMQVFDEAPVPKAVVPHAPYSVSAALFDQIKSKNSGKATISIHNQETMAEEEFFKSGTGPFYNFYNQFGFTLERFTSNGKASIYYAMENMDPLQRNLFVHNTLTTREDIDAAHQWSDQVYWTTCPNANLFIENRLPDYRKFIDSSAKLTIGTDSLTSNWQLSILEEMKTISRYQSYVPFEILLQWATLNGAEALGMQEKFGSLEIGKTPGLILLNFAPDQETITAPNIAATRIV